MDILDLLILLTAPAVVLLLYLAAAQAMFRLGGSDRFATEVRRRCRWWARGTVVLIGLLAALPLVDLPEDLGGPVALGLIRGTIVLGSITLLRLASAVEQTVITSQRLQQRDNARVRGAVTRVVLLRRVAVGVVVVMALGGLLMTFETGRTLGTSVLASAGVLGLVAGVAAQATLGNVVAGIQLAVAAPLRLDDVVVVEGEWGNIEQVGLTHVVVRTWDRRRLVLPTTYFTNTPFENWTRRGSQVIGSVLWEVDHRAPFDDLRLEVHRLVESHPLWDGDVVVLQVVESDARSVTLRALVTAATPQEGWDLRCDVREGLIAHMAAHHPEALPRVRLDDVGVLSDR